MSRILVVDDDISVLATVQMLLVHHGYDVVAVDRGSRGVQALTRGHFDAVIVDIFMPGMDGYETIREFQKIAPGIPLIAMSGIMFRESHSAPAPDFLYGDQHGSGPNVAQTLQAGATGRGGACLPRRRDRTVRNAPKQRALT
jgi:CheY-like chemotaxis protein